MSRLPIPPAALDQHVIVLGKTRAGKSSKLRVLVEHLLRKDEPVSIIDPKGDWWGLKSSADGKGRGFPIVIFGGKHADVPINQYAGAHVAELFATGNRSCLIDLRGWMPGERTRFFIDYAAALFQHTRGARHQVIDEVHNFAPKGKIFDPEAGKMLHWANRLASEGSGLGLTLLAASQRPQKVHNDFLTSCETLIACKVIHSSDRGAIKDWIDGCADADKGKQVLAELAGMKKPEAWVWSPEVEFGPARVTWPLFETYDSFKPQPADARKLKGWADVDLEEVKTKLAAVVEEAKANDPAELKRRIRELEKQVAKPVGTAPPAVAAAQDLAQAETRGYVDGEKEGYRRAVVAANEQLVNTVHGLRGGLLEALQLSAGEAVERVFKKLPRPKLAPPLTLPAAAVKHVERHRSPPSAIAQLLAARGGNGEDRLPRVRQQILDRLLWLEEHGIEPAPKEALAAVCGASSTSSAFQNNLGALRAAGLIDYPAPGLVRLAAGRANARSIEDHRPLHEHWFDVVSGPQRRILEQLLAAHPGVMTKDELADAVGASSSSSAYQNNLGRLRTLGAIDYPVPGEVALTRHVVPT